MENKLVKVYAAYRSGCLGDNILDTYFRFFANIIYDQHWEEIDEAVLVDHFPIDTEFLFLCRLRDRY